MAQKLIKASIKSLRISPQKLNLVVSMVRDMKLPNALMQLSFSHKRVAKDVKKCIQSCISNAENNFGIDIDNLFIKSIMVGKSIVMKRARTRAKGRRTAIHKPFSRLNVVLAEREVE